MENINIAVQEKIINVTVSGGVGRPGPMGPQGISGDQGIQGPQGEPGLTKSEIVAVSIPSIAYGEDHNVSITVAGANPTLQHIVSIGNSHNIPSEIIIKRLVVSSLNNVSLRIANDGSNPSADLSAAFSFTIQVINY